MPEQKLRIVQAYQSQDGNVFACRSEQTSIFKLGFFSNRLILWGILTEWILILCIIFLQPLENLFATAPL